MLLIEIRCDACDGWGDQAVKGVKSAAQLRADLRKMGWVRYRNKDYCQDCKDDIQYDSRGGHLREKKVSK